MNKQKVIYRAVVKRSLENLESESLEVHAYLTSCDEDIQEVYRQLKREVFKCLNITPFETRDLEDKA